jgi:hypothetical protein
VLAALSAAVLLTAAPPTEAKGKATNKPETQAQRLHRKGVFCQEEIERSKCAIKNFEELLEERTEERELITDALLRLVKIYAKAGEDERVKELIRRFWDAGRGRARFGHLLYSTRYLPKDFDAFAAADFERVLTAPLSQRIPADMVEYPFVCDEARREQIHDIWLLRRAQRRARDKNISTRAALEQLVRERKARSARYEQRKAQQDADAEKSGKPPAPSYAPLFAEHTCETARALGQPDLRGWRRVNMALHHGDLRRSVMILEIPTLAALLEQAARRGALTPVQDKVWSIAGADYYGQAVHVARLDLDELTVAPAAIMQTIVKNHAKQRNTINRELRQLLVKIPSDSSFFAAATEQTLHDLGFGGMKKGRRKLFEFLLPRPKGIQLAGVVHEYLGVFVRMPTDTPLKGEMLVSIARRLIENASEDDGDADLLKLLDISQTSDKRALLLSYVLSRSQILEMMVQ